MINRFYLLACLAPLAISASSFHAAALMNTDQLQSICAAGLADPTKENPRFAYCTGLMIGLLMADALEQNRICVPEDLDTKSGLKTFLMRSAIEKDKDIEGTVTMFRAFSEKYPCK